MTEWFRLPEGELMSRLKTGREGLTGQEAERRLLQYGENVIQEKGRRQWWQVFLEQFKDLLVIILLVAAGISMVTGDAGSAGVIFAVLLLNAVLGTVQHQRAEKSLESLRTLSSPEARVRRRGMPVVIPSSQVVPGDILLLEAGDLAAADGRLIEANGLKVNESSLTGEALDVDKRTGELGKTGGERAAFVAGGAALGDRVNMVFSGSLVTMGKGEAVVTATGMATEIGRIAGLMNDTREQKTPLQVSLDRFSGRLAAAIMAICAAVFGLSLLRGEPVLSALMFAVALAVAAIPEALSSIVTIVQAMGTQKMAGEQAIIKDLKAVESLGCVSVICSDKTGTLTQNRMKAEAVYAGGREYGPGQFKQAAQGDGGLLFRAAVLDNNASLDGGRGMGDPTETALLCMAEQAGLSPEGIRGECPRLYERPFDSKRKLMSAASRTGQGDMLFVKGAVDVLLKRCTRILCPIREEGGAAFREITGPDRRRILGKNGEWAAGGLRVLAFACRPLREGDPGDEEDLIFLGLAAMMDPLRAESRGAVARAKEAGIRTVMITGDHRDTAAAAAAALGILVPGGRTVTGAELDQMDERELAGCLEEISVYARVSPEHKLRIVEAWQKKGRIVAMTGDGVNDGPALKKADIGVAMGLEGTEVAREAASMILADDNFATIIKAVANGRNVYRNIKNAIRFLLSGNMAGILCVLITSLSAWPMPFAPVHLLFINLITDSLPAIAIGMEPPEGELLQSPPRDPAEGILTGAFIRDILAEGGLLAAVTIWAYLTGLSAGGGEEASTMAFSTLTLARLFHGFNCRGRHSILRLGLLSNPYSLMAFELGTALLMAVLFVPGLQAMFAASDLSLSQLLTVACAALTPTLIIQAFKTLRECLE